MAARSTSNFSYLLKTHYTPEFNKALLDVDNEVLKRFYANRRPAGGKNITTPIRVRRAAGSTGGITETGALKTAAVPTDYEVIDNLKIVETSKEISQLAINVSKGNEFAYLSALDDMNQDAVSEHADHLNKVLFNTGGYWAQCASCSTLTITLATGMNSRMFYVGQTVAILEKSTGQVNGIGHAGTTVTAVNHTNNTVTVAAIGTAASVDSTYWICDTSNVTTNTTTSLIPYGLPDLIGTGNLHGVNTGTYPEFVSQLINGASGDLTLEKMQQLVDECEIYNGGTISYFLCHDKLMRKYQYNVIEPQTVRMPGDASYGTGGTGEMYFKGRSKRKIPILTAAYCSPTDDLYAIDSSAIVPYSSAYVEWMDDDGKVLDKKSGYYTYEAVLSTELQNIAVSRFKCGVIYNLDIS